MFKNLKKSLKRAIIFILILGAIFVTVLTVTNLSGDKLFAKKLDRVLIDSDSGTDLGDLFAISRAIISSDLKLIGLTSVHSEFDEEAGDRSLEQTQKLHGDFLRRFNKSSLPHPPGAKKAIAYSRDISPRKSAAAEFIIKSAHETGKNRKLNIVCLGALTNLASAIMMDEEIVPKIRVYMLAMKYRPKTKVWNKNEYNARNDLDALDYILNTNGLELHIMAANAAEELVFTREETLKYLNDKSQAWEFLISQWNEKHRHSEEVVMEEVALIEALLDPELVKTEESLTPPENYQRTVRVYTVINKELMVADYFAEVLKYQRSNDSINEE